MTLGPLSIPRDDLDIILSKVGENWKQLNHQRLLLTGGTGFVGKWLLSSFLHANRELSLRARAVVVTRSLSEFLRQFPELLSYADIDFVESDVKTLKLPASLGCTFCIHAATDVAKTVTPYEVIDTAYLGTRRVLDQMPSTVATRILLLSSGAVYDKASANGEKMAEILTYAPSTQLPASAYAYGKRLSELTTSIHRDLNPLSETVIARLFSFIGPHLPLDKQFAIGNFILSALNGQPIRVNSDGSALRSYLYSAELAEWLWTLLFQGTNGEIYNVGGDESIAIKDLAYKVRSLVNRSVDVEIRGEHKAFRLTDVYVPSVSKIKNELKVRSRVSLDGSIIKTSQWIKDLKAKSN